MRRIVVSSLPSIEKVPGDLSRHCRQTMAALSEGDEAFEAVVIEE